MKKIILLTTLFLSGVTYAQQQIKEIPKEYNSGFQGSLFSLGNEGGGGGDLACDAKIKTIADNIRFWIQNHGPEVGNLNLSSSIYPAHSRPYTLPEYRSFMLNLFQLSLDSSCVTEGDPGYPVKIGDSSKICVTTKDAQGLHMKCDQIKFLALSPDAQIEQIHHEFAIHVPGLEPVDGPISTYKISLQLSAYTQNVVERKLVVVPAKKTDGSKLPYQTFKSAFDYADPARLQDFPLLADFKNPQINLKCAVVFDPNDTEPTSKVYDKRDLVFGRIDIVLPDNGPLSAGKTISIISPIMTILYEEYKISTSFNNEIAQGFISKNGNVLLNTAINSDGDLQTDFTPDIVPQKTAHYIYRKKGNLFFVHGFGEFYNIQGRAISIDQYGYCYRN